MTAILELLRHHPELALFATLSLGYFFGQFKFGPIALAPWQVRFSSGS